LSSLERDRVPSPRPIAAKEVPLVDRVEEMNVLKEAVYRAVHGDGGLVFIHGEAGIGKTRLVRELGAYARSRGVQVLYGRCPALFRMDGVPPYIIWKEVIKDYLETCIPEQLYRVIGYYPAEVAKLVPELSQKLRSIPQSLPISPEQEQNRLFEAVSQFIMNISRETPLLVILDDLQWTDPSSLLLLHYLARGVQKTPLLLLGAYRSTDIDDKHPLTPVLAELNRERLPQEIQLKRMSFSDVSEMIKNILEQEDVPEEFCKLVYEKTRGNPFFAEEVVKSLKEEGAIYLEEGKWKFKEVSAIEFPKSVKNIVKARFSRLDDEYQNVLTFASFVGNDFTLEAMCELTGVEENRLLEIMDGLLKAGFIKHTVTRGEDICSFADIIVRDVVYEEVGPFKRKKLHGVVGSALEKIYAKTIDEHLGELASHFLESGDKDKALDYFLKAGEKATGIYANTEAASYFQSALTLLEEKEREPQERGRVLERLGDIKKLAGEYDACMKYWNEALPLLTEKQDKEKTAVLHRKMANVLWDKMGNAEKAKEHHDACLKIMETELESVENARLYHDMAYMQWRNGDYVKALASAEKALALAEKLNALDVVADACLDLSCVLWFSGNYKKSREYANRGLKTALDNGYLEIAVLAYDRVGGFLPPEEYEERLEYFEKGLSLAKKVGDISRQSWFLGDLADIYSLMGKFDKAIALGEEALALDRKVGSIAYTPGFLVALGSAYQMLGEWSKSEQFYNDAVAVSGKLTDSLPKAFTHFYLGWLHFDKEEYTRARELFEEAYKVAESLGNREAQMQNYWFLILTCVELGETGKAENLLDSLQKYALETEGTWHKINEMALRAMLLRAQKKWDESIELFQKTLREWKSVKADIWNAYLFAKWVLCEYARAHLERNEEGDKEKARDLLNQALEIFQKMGAKKDIEKVEAKLLYIETGKLASVPKPTELVAIGYADLDKLLCGGIPQNFAVVLASPSCDERDMLVKSFLETGAKKGEVAFYVTTDLGLAKPLAEFRSSLCLFVCNPQADAIIEDSPNVIKLKGVENLTDISIALTSAVRKLDPSVKRARRACIEIVSDALLQHHAVQTRKWLTALLPELRSAGFTTLAVVDPRMHPSEELYSILGLFEGEIDIYEKETEKGAGKFLKIKKMSNHKYLENDLFLKKEEP
jgi:tetratricopeptide (TPR) repeat protein/KaiC/GvpD/RAD55 family RecA-like ATPase